MLGLEVALHRADQMAHKVDRFRLEMAQPQLQGLHPDLVRLSVMDWGLLHIADFQHQLQDCSLSVPELVRLWEMVRLSGLDWDLQRPAGEFL